MNAVTNEAVYELQNKYNLSPLEMDQITTSFFATYEYNPTKELLEQHIKGYLLTRGMTEVKEAETVKEVDTINNNKGWDVVLITEPNVIRTHGNEEYGTYGAFKCISQFEGTTIDEWNNYIAKRGCQNAVLDFMEQAKKDFPNGKVPSKKTIQRHIKKLIESNVPLLKVEKYNGKVYYKLLNCVMTNSKPNYFIRVPYAQMRELVIVTNGDMLRLYALVCSILQAKNCGYDKYHPITRKYLAECLGYNANSEAMLAAIGTMLRALCKLGHLECLETVETSKNGNTYKTIHSYRRTTLEEWQEANKRGTITK